VKKQIPSIHSRSTAWAYDSLGQVTRADSSIPGLDRAYQFDMIGNRLKTADSLTLPSANNYIPNALNQYTAIQEGGTGVSPVHDDDGNMTSGPLPANINANSTLVWDGENRLIEATAGTTGSLVRYFYDSQSRRIAEKVGTATKITLYDGWNPIAEYQFHNSSFNLHTSRLWGMDLSGSMQGAGGVGGLLMVSEISNSQISNYFPTYDGNGNVSEYLNSSGTVVAHYEYNPFGRTTVATGPKANDFAHRFSTKPLDSATGLYYYTYRYYDPLTGRWPSRDPIGEEGGVNMYGFVGNDGVNAWDVLGLIGPYYSPNWGIPPSNSKPRPCSPGAGDQFNPFGLRGDTSKKNYKNWFETRFPKTVAGAKSDLETRIKEKVCATKGQSPSTIPDLTDGKDDIDVKNDMKRYGDPAQGPWERHVQIGNFEFKAKNVKITNWHKEPPPNCADCFDYEATVYIEEQTGADPPWAPGGEDCYEDPLWFTGMFGKRKVNMGEWNVKGAHCCP
jgi:RHS repeat-associated protein